MISIIATFHNMQQFVSTCIDSLLSQVYLDIEIIVVVDRSKDATAQILSTKYSTYTNISIHSVDFGNASASRNFGLSIAKGDYIQWVDGDDYIHPFKLKMQLEKMQLDNSELCACKTISVDNNGWAISIVSPRVFDNVQNPSLFLKTLLANPETHMVQPNAWLVKRSVIDRVGCWNENLTLDDDGEFFCRVIANVDYISYVDTVLNYYRKSDGRNNLASLRSRNHLISARESLTMKLSYIRNNCSETEFEMIKHAQICSFLVTVNYENKDLLKSDFRQIKSYCKLQKPILGGFVIESIKNLFGFKFAILLRMYYYHLIK